MEAGRTARVELVVGEADTAVAMGSGDVPVLATPRVLALAEEAAVAALDGGLDPGLTSVGSYAEVEHLTPTPVGAAVVAEATLEQVNGRSLSFAVVVLGDGGDEVARVRHRRAVVRRTSYT